MYKLASLCLILSIHVIHFETFITFFALFKGILYFSIDYLV